MSSPIILSNMKLQLLNFCTLLLLFVSLEAIQLRIYNGNDAWEEQFPYMALLTYDEPYAGPWKMCGAGIIHPRWAITAAHCVLSDDSPKLTVGTIGDIGTGETYDVERFYVHENYTLIPESWDNDLEVVYNDIGLIRLKSPIQFNDKVNKIKLETDESKTYENVTATVLGWGRETYYGSASDHLRYAKVRVLSMDECRKVWTYADKHICTSNKEKGVCNGDSGSPLVVNGVQIGVTSTTDTYCESLKPDMYTKVASFIPWVKSKLSEYGDSLGE